MMSKSRFRRWGTTLVAVPVMVLGAMALSATSAAASIGVVTVDADTQTDVGGDDTETVTAECNGGSTLIGTGWIAGGAIVDEVVPDLSTGTVRVEAWEPEGGSVRANWSVTARAICATSVSNVEVVQDGSSAYNSTNAPKSDTASCPFAKKLVGLGYEIGTFAEGEVHVTSVVPTEDEVTVTAYEDDNGTTESWSVTAYAVCATEPSGLEVVTSTSPSTSSDLTVCPGVKKAIGAGGAVDSARNNVDIWYAKTGAYGGYEYGIAGAAETSGATTSNWTITSTVICANP
jgi:hypothetical protein